MTITTVPFPEGKDQDLLTLAEVAAVLRTPVNTLRWWRQCGEGPAFFKIGRHLVTTLGDLRAWVEEPKSAPVDEGLVSTDRAPSVPKPRRTRLDARIDCEGEGDEDGETAAGRRDVGRAEGAPVAERPVASDWTLPGL